MESFDFSGQQCEYDRDYRNVSCWPESFLDSYSFTNTDFMLRRAQVDEYTDKNETTRSRYSSGALFRRCTMRGKGLAAKTARRTDIYHLCVAKIRR